MHAAVEVLQGVSQLLRLLGVCLKQVQSQPLGTFVANGRQARELMDQRSQSGGKLVSQAEIILVICGGLPPKSLYALLHKNLEPLHVCRAFSFGINKIDEIEVSLEICND